MHDWPVWKQSSGNLRTTTLWNHDDDQKWVTVYCASATSKQTSSSWTSSWFLKGLVHDNEHVRRLSLQNKFVGSTLRVCSFRRIQKRIFDPRFARFRGRKEREIRNWICNLGNLSPTRAVCTTASQKMTCFLLFDKLCDYTVQNLVVGSSNSDDGTYKTDKERSALKLNII